MSKLRVVTVRRIKKPPLVIDKGGVWLGSDCWRRPGDNIAGYSKRAENKNKLYCNKGHGRRRIRDSNGQHAHSSALCSPRN